MQIQQKGGQSSKAEDLLACGHTCGKQIACGHECSQQCHAGPCSPPSDCSALVTVRCSCRRRRQRVCCSEVSILQCFQLLCICTRHVALARLFSYKLCVRDYSTSSTLVLLDGSLLRVLGRASLIEECTSFGSPHGMPTQVQADYQHA